MDLHSALTADGAREMNKTKAPSMRPRATSMPTSPIRAVVEAVAQEHKRADDSLAHRLAMDVLGLTSDPLKGAVEKAVTSRVDIYGKLTKGPGSF